MDKQNEINHKPVKQIIIMRNVGDSIEKYEFEYDEVSAGKKLEQNIILQRGDVVVVP